MADAIQDAGFSLEEFETITVDGEWVGLIDSTTRAFRHKPSGSTFAFEFLGEMSDGTGYGYDPGGYACSYRPGRESPSETHLRLSWARFLDLFRGWLVVIVREANAAVPGTYPEPKVVSSDQRRHEASRANRLAIPDTRAVFIAFGKDEANALRLEQLLKERYQLEPIVMKSLPGRGRTLIEKFEDEAAQCSFAYALLTPDDQVKTSEDEYTQARPNVVFELGWFYGRLGRGRVVLLVKQGTQIHSDLQGISRVDFQNSVEERILDIERELRAAGLLI